MNDRTAQIVAAWVFALALAPNCRRASPSAPALASRLQITQQTTLHEPRRIIQEGARLFHQVRFGADWQDVCEFTLEEMPLIDRELANWYTSAHPASHFKNRLIVARAAPDGRRVSFLNDELTLRERDGAATTRRIASAAELLAVLFEQFGLSFPSDTRLGGSGKPWPV